MTASSGVSSSCSSCLTASSVSRPACATARIEMTFQRGALLELMSQKFVTRHAELGRPHQPQSHRVDDTHADNLKTALKIVRCAGARLEDQFRCHHAEPLSCACRNAPTSPPHAGTVSNIDRSLGRQMPQARMTSEPIRFDANGAIPARLTMSGESAVRHLAAAPTLGREHAFLHKSNAPAPSGRSRHSDRSTRDAAPLVGSPVAMPCHDSWGTSAAATSSHWLAWSAPTKCSASVGAMCFGSRFFSST